MYTEEQFTQLAEAKLYHYQHQQQEQQETLQKPRHYHQHHHYHQQQTRPSYKRDNIYVKMGDLFSGNGGAFRLHQQYSDT